MYFLSLFTTDNLKVEYYYYYRTYVLRQTSTMVHTRFIKIHLLTALTLVLGLLLAVRKLVQIVLISSNETVAVMVTLPTNKCQNTQHQ